MGSAAKLGATSEEPDGTGPAKSSSSRARTTPQARPEANKNEGPGLGNSSLHIFPRIVALEGAIREAGRAVGGHRDSPGAREALDGCAFRAARGRRRAETQRRARELKERAMETLRGFSQKSASRSRRARRQSRGEARVAGADWTRPWGPEGGGGGKAFEELHRVPGETNDRQPGREGARGGERAAAMARRGEQGSSEGRRGSRGSRQSRTPDRRRRAARGRSRTGPGVDGARCDESAIERGHGRDRGGPPRDEDSLDSWSKASARPRRGAGAGREKSSRSPSGSSAGRARGACPRGDRGRDRAC